MDWFISDTHFAHENIIRYCNRPFKILDENGQVKLDDQGREMVDVEKHDQTIIDNINERVRPQDNLWHLGDFCLPWDRRDATRAALGYLECIHCRHVFLIVGNHDPHLRSSHVRPEFAKLFEGCWDLHRIRVEFRKQTRHIVLCHYAMRTWRSSHRGAWHLWGHSHYTLPDDPHALSLDVGVDAVAGRATGKTIEELKKDPSVLQPKDYHPISVEEVSELMSRKQFSPIITT